MEGAGERDVERGATRLSVLAALVLALAAWSGSVARGGLALDDAEILESPVVTGALPWTAAFDRDYWHHRGDAGHWRPTAVLALRADRALWGADPRGYHATNVALHLLVVWLAGLLLARALPNAFPWLGLAVFAAHPALADAVAWVSGRSSMLCAAGGLLGALGVLRATRAKAPPFASGLAAALGLALALLGKEEGVAFAALYVLLGARRSRPHALACAAGSALALAGWLLARQLALGEALPSAPHAPLAGAPIVERLAVGGAAAVEGLRRLAAPLGGAPTNTVEALEGPGFVARALLGWSVLGALSLGAALAARMARRSEGARATLAGSAALVAIAWLPYTQLVPAGEVFAPRFLYLPLLAAVPLVDALARHAVPGVRGRLALGAVLALLTIPLAWRQAGVYASRAAFRRAVLVERPHDAPSWNDLGLALEEEGDARGARDAWRTAAALDPTYGRPWSNLGRVALAAGELLVAREALERAVRLGPANPVARVNLASVHLRAGDARAAEEQYAKATELAPGLAPAWRGLGQARLAAGDRAGARDALELAHALAPDDDATARLLERAADR